MNKKSFPFVFTTRSEGFDKGVKRIAQKDKEEIEMNESRAQASLVACTLACDPMGKERVPSSFREGGGENVLR